jgi:hypothetical protein
VLNLLVIEVSTGRLPRARVWCRSSIGVFDSRYRSAVADGCVQANPTHSLPRTVLIYLVGHGSVGTASDGPADPAPSLIGTQAGCGKTLISRIP